jgi:3-oxoacyl-[acyl-carrier-protein] synthase-1
MFITGTGMVCPVGLSAVSACAAKRAGISAFAELPYSDNAGEPVIGGSVPGLCWTLARDSRLVMLLTKALTDLLNGQPDLQWVHVPLLVCLAESGRPGGGAALARSIVKWIENELKVQFHPTNSRAFPSGHTAGFEALREARNLIQRGDVPACIVCATDSFLNAASLFWLDQHYRLKTPANRDGVIPGEAAAAVLVQADPSAAATVEVIGLGFAKEQASILSEEPLLGLGLAAAARSALGQAKLGLNEIDVRLSDVTGELYGFKELPLIEGRLMRVVRKEAQPLWHWAEAIGDSGAAAGVAQLVLANEAFKKGYAPGQRAICFSSSVAGERAVAVLRHCQTSASASGN